MGVYIDRDELLELYANTDDLDISDYDVKVAVIRQNILDMPTIDLVRCRECKHKMQALSTEKNAIGCELISGTFYEDFFCKCGERRADCEDETDEEWYDWRDEQEYEDRWERRADEFNIERD